MLNILIYLAVRVLHVLFAAIWIGSTVFTSLLLAPAADEAGRAGGEVMARLDRRGFHVAMATFAGTTVLSGVFLLWRYTGGFDPTVIATPTGIAFIAGGSAGVLASIVGGGVVGRNAKRVLAIMGQAVALPDGEAKGSLVLQAAAARRRVKAGSQVVMALQAAALLLMTVGHYV